MDAKLLSLEMNEISSRTGRIMVASFLLHCVVGLILLTGEDKTGMRKGADFTEIVWIKDEGINTGSGHLDSKRNRPVEVKGKGADPVNPDHSVPEPPASRLSNIIRQGGSREESGLMDAVKLALGRPPGTDREKGIESSGRRFGIKLIRGEQGVERELHPNREKVARLKLRVTEASILPMPEKRTDTREAVDGGEASLEGPVSDRALLSYRLPGYPGWAKSEGIEVSASIYFEVRPDGRVDDNILIEETSGYQDFDRSAVEAVLSWRFQPVEGNLSANQWGRITFEFRIEESGGRRR